MLIWYEMYWYGSYKGSKWSVKTEPPGKHKTLHFNRVLILIGLQKIATSLMPKMVMYI